MTLLTPSFLIDIEKRFQTPVFLYESDILNKRYCALRKMLTPCCDIFYSIKANPLLSLCQYFFQLGANCEVSSSNELMTALKAGFHPDQIIFVGPAKNKFDIKLCIEKGIRAIVCESIEEIFCVDVLSKSVNKRTPILIRINPDFHVVKAPIKMSGVATQFGIDVNQLILHQQEINTLKYILLNGIHIYNGSRILDAAALIENAKKILSLSEYLSSIFQIEWETIDIGGGLGVPYFENESPLMIETLIGDLNIILLQHQKKYPKTRFILELGRYLVAESGYLIASVQAIKKSHDKNYVLVDAGMHCHLAVTGLGSFVHRNFPAEIISRTTSNLETGLKKYQIAGPLCTPGDIILRDFLSREISVGDFVVIKNVGAYGVSASPGRFLSHGSPAEIIYRDHQLFLARRRETLHDILLCQYDLDPIFYQQEKNYVKHRAYC